MHLFHCLNKYPRAVSLTSSYQEINKFNVSLADIHYWLIGYIGNSGEDVGTNTLNPSLADICYSRIRHSGVLLKLCTIIFASMFIIMLLIICSCSTNLPVFCLLGSEAGEGPKKNFEGHKLSHGEISTMAEKSME